MTGRKRILLLSYCLDYGGSERQLTEVARSVDPAMYEVHVGCMRRGGLREPELREAGIRIVEFPMTSFFSIGAVYQTFRLISYIHSNQIDLVHAFDVPMDVFGAPAAKLSLRSGCADQPARASQPDRRRKVAHPAGNRSRRGRHCGELRIHSPSFD